MTSLRTPKLSGKEQQEEGKDIVETLGLTLPLSLYLTVSKPLNLSDSQLATALYLYSKDNSASFVLSVQTIRLPRLSHHVSVQHLA